MFDTVAWALAAALVGAPPAEPPALEPERLSPRPPPMTWDIEGGGIPSGGVLATAQTGFSRWLEVRLEIPVVEGLLVGAWLGMDLGQWTPAGAGDDLGLAFGARARYRLLHDSEWSVGITASPGGRARLSGRGGGELLIPLSARALYAFDKRVLVGAALDLPLRFAFPARDDPFFALPLTIGFAGEVHLLPSLALTAVLGLGPALDTRGVELALRGTIGVGYRL